MRQLIVKNFGPVSDASIEIRKFNLFIGEQSVGKSTLAKLIAIFTDYMNLFLFSADGANAWKKTLESYDLQVYAKKPYTIRYEEQVRNIAVSVGIHNGIVTTHVAENGIELTDNESRFKALMANKPFYHDENIAKFRELPADQENLPMLLEYIRNSLYIPAERIIASQINKLLPVITMGKEQLPMNLLRYMSELNNAKVTYPKLQLDLLNVTYAKKQEEDWIILSNNDELPLKLASSGIQSTLPLLLVFKYGMEKKEYASFVVEEPECNLFPQKQVELLQQLIHSISDDDKFLTITTHSPYLLSALNNYLYAGRIAKELTESKDDLKAIVSEDLWLKSDDCAIYSLGETINGGEYYLDLVDPNTGMIDFNYLDGVSLTMSEEFGKLNNLFIRYQRAKRNK